jgi:hypothetical protein
MRRKLLMVLTVLFGFTACHKAPELAKQTVESVLFERGPIVREAERRSTRLFKGVHGCSFKLERIIQASEYMKNRGLDGDWAQAIVRLNCKEGLENSDARDTTLEMVFANEQGRWVLKEMTNLMSPS